MYGSFVVYFIEFSICLAAFTLLFKLLFKDEKCFAFNRYYLLLIPLVSILVPKIYYGVQIESLTNLPQLYHASNFEQSITIQVEKIGHHTQIINWRYLIIVTYLSGVILSMFKIVCGLLKFNQFAKSAPGHVDNGIRKIYIKGLETPFSMFNTIVLPKNHQRLKLIEQHEISHCTNKHTWDILYFEILKTFLWFHPLVYILKNWLKEQHEFAADSDVIRENQSKFLYASALVNQSAGITKNIIPFTNHFNSLTIKNRLKMIAKTENQKIVLLKTSAVLPLLMLLLFAFSVHFETVAQKSDDYKAGKIYTTIESDDPGAKEQKIQAIIKEKKEQGKTISRDDIIFISRDELDKIAMSVHEEAKTVSKPDNFKVSLDKSAGKLSVKVAGKPTELLSNSISYTKTIDAEAKKMETVTLAMANGQLPPDFKLDESYKNVRVGNFKLKLNGSTKIYDDFYIDITNDCN